MTSRRKILEKTAHVCGATIAAAAGASTLARAQSSNNDGAQRFFIFSLVGSENPTRANFPFVWASALTEAGHEVRIELAGDATVLMRDVVVENMVAVGWPPMRQYVEAVIRHEIPIFV
jgi:hypothetical protein